MLLLKQWPWRVSLLIQASFSGIKSVRREDEEVGDGARKRWLWLFTHSSIHFCVWEFSMCIWKGNRRSQANSVYSKTSYLFFFLVIWLLVIEILLVRKESLLEGKKWKKEKQSSFVNITTCLAFISVSFHSTKENYGAYRIFLF